MLNKKKNNKGFTLVELLVVIAIIGILAVVAVPALFSNINKAKVADLEADYSAFKSAALSYYTDNNTFYVEDKNVVQTTVDETNALSEYMENIPTKSPFDDNYSIDIEKKKNATANDPYHLVLKTTLKDKLSDKAKDKLINDLGTDVVLLNEPNASSGKHQITISLVKGVEAKK
ncbi:MAG: type II secretion system protein [Paraclostridium sp.]